MSTSSITRRLTVGIAVVGTSVTFAACSSSSSGTGAGNPSTTTGTTLVPFSSPQVSSTGTTAGTTTDTAAGCGAKAVAAVRATLASATEVTGVQVDGGCHQLSIATNMASADQLSPSGTKAVAICKAAAQVGYQDGVNSVTVSWSDGHEAAAGLQGQDCIPG